jgi:hypothetical protein
MGSRLNSLGWRTVLLSLVLGILGASLGQAAAQPPSQPTTISWAANSPALGLRPGQITVKGSYTVTPNWGVKSITIIATPLGPGPNGPLPPVKVQLPTTEIDFVRETFSTEMRGLQPGVAYSVMLQLVVKHYYPYEEMTADSEARRIAIPAAPKTATRPVGAAPRNAGASAPKPGAPGGGSTPVRRR